jgi:hypothetical protein
MIVEKVGHFNPKPWGNSGSRRRTRNQFLDLTLGDLAADGYVRNLLVSPLTRNKDLRLPYEQPKAIDSMVAELACRFNEPLIETHVMARTR